ncbi:hypothetical protein B0I35DRAFT_476672 [Stachybotrys elegans]|uniref:Uncharacterized protein n=1 Tax=Stachybotrys elegans TaxID=80388 RepID=A0A8K0SUF4_9HYPO|nr:hypothetical protein B0I35DRAFT_476672 [Stachybotrys elegans]
MDATTPTIPKTHHPEPPTTESTQQAAKAKLGSLGLGLSSPPSQPQLQLPQSKAQEPELAPRISDSVELSDGGLSVERPASGVNSCPELGDARRKNTYSSTDSHGTCTYRRGSRSQPLTPPKMRHRILDLGIRRVRFWPSSRDSHAWTADNTPPRQTKDARERRRQARDSRARFSSSHSSPLLSPSPTTYEGTAPLAMAGMMLATAELDRLSQRARDEASSGAKRKAETESA